MFVRQAAQELFRLSREQVVVIGCNRVGLGLFWVDLFVAFESDLAMVRAEFRRTALADQTLSDFRYWSTPSADVKAQVVGDLGTLTDEPNGRSLRVEPFMLMVEDGLGRHYRLERGNFERALLLSEILGAMEHWPLLKGGVRNKALLNTLVSRTRSLIRDICDPLQKFFDPLH